MYLYTKSNLVIDTHISDKFITPKTFLNTRNFCKVFFIKKRWREYFSSCEISSHMFHWSHVLANREAMEANRWVIYSGFTTIKCNF